jgi:anti-sigma28 factor (negative regulator of flagellin synthesis)
MMKNVSLQEIIERVNEKGESPLEVAASYGVSKDTLRRRIKESAGLLIDNKTKKYHDEQGEVACAADYEGVLLELIRGKGNTLRDKSTNKTRAKHTHDTSSAHVRHAHDTQNTQEEHTNDTLSSKEVKALRKLLQEWKILKGQLNHLEVATSVEVVTLEKRWTELDPKAKRSRRAYKVSDQVWQQFDEIVNRTQMEKGQALEIALVDFIKCYKPE